MANDAERIYIYNPEQAAEEKVDCRWRDVTGNMTIVTAAWLNPF